MTKYNSKLELLERSDETKKKKVLIMLEFEHKDDTEFRMQYENMLMLLEMHNYKIVELLEK